jgi:hypothetical protein
MMRYSDGVGRLLTARRPRLRAHEPVELKAHRVGECPDACGVPLQLVVHCKSPFLTDKTLDVTVYSF